MIRLLVLLLRHRPSPPFPAFPRRFTSGPADQQCAGGVLIGGTSMVCALRRRSWQPNRNDFHYRHIVYETASSTAGDLLDSTGALPLPSCWPATAFSLPSR